jgi:hypothetical protein
MVASVGRDIASEGHDREGPMLLSAWRADGSHPAAMTPKVDAVLEPVLRGLGAEADPDCWVVWGDEPGRWSLLTSTPAGLVSAHVRVSSPLEGPRATGKLVRWNRVQVGDYSVEMHAGHRLLSFQIENQVLHGVDDECDALAAFIQRLLALMDGRAPIAAR